MFWLRSSSMYEQLSWYLRQWLQRNVFRPFAPGTRATRQSRPLERQPLQGRAALTPCSSDRSLWTLMWSANALLDTFLWQMLQSLTLDLRGDDSSEDEDLCRSCLLDCFLTRAWVRDGTGLAPCRGGSGARKLRPRPCRWGDGVLEPREGLPVCIWRVVCFERRGIVLFVALDEVLKSGDGVSL